MNSSHDEPRRWITEVGEHGNIRLIGGALDIVDPKELPDDVTFAHIVVRPAILVQVHAAKLAELHAFDCSLTCEEEIEEGLDEAEIEEVILGCDIMLDSHPWLEANRYADGYDGFIWDSITQDCSTNTASPVQHVATEPLNTTTPSPRAIQPAPNVHNLRCYTLDNWIMNQVRNDLLASDEDELAAPGIQTGQSTS